MTTATVSSPGELETALLQALTALPRPEQQPSRIAAAATAVEHRVWTIPARVRGFTGRAELLAELEETLQSGEPIVVQAVTGMGGIGKTTAAIEYAHRHRDEFDIAWWVPAEDPALIPQRLAELALALALSAATDAAGVGVARLLGELARRDRWLLVFDNAEDPRALSRFLPEGSGQVLITSRSPTWRGIADVVGVREFTRTESITLLRWLAPDVTDVEADRVAAAVGDLPLAIEQAGSLLADTGMLVDKYLRLLGERAQDVLDHDPGVAYPRSVAASWLDRQRHGAVRSAAGDGPLGRPLDGRARRPAGALPASRLRPHQPRRAVLLGLRQPDARQRHRHRAGAGRDRHRDASTIRSGARSSRPATRRRRRGDLGRPLIEPIIAPSQRMTITSQSWRLLRDHPLRAPTTTASRVEKARLAGVDGLRQVSDSIDQCSRFAAVNERRVDMEVLISVADDKSGSLLESLDDWLRANRHCLATLGPSVTRRPRARWVPWLTRSS